MISIRDLRVQRNGRDVLQVKSLEIKRGETLAIVGPNGAGKSTFLLALANLIKPVQGDIVFNEKSIKEWDELEYRRRIAFVFQEPLLMDMSVQDNIALGLKFRGVKNFQEQVMKWSQAMGVDSLLQRRANQLSGGEAQRVSLARAFVLNPELLLMDEPFSAVDPQTRTQFLKDLSKVLGQEQRTTIFVTHNLKEAAQFGDRVAIMIDGIFRQVGSARQIKAKPVDQVVKKFLRELPVS
ncbi:MAG: ABC transporter ATP-binding protein [Anaerolineales bacterium]